MQWSEISLLLMMILLLGWGISLMRQNSILKKETLRLLKKTGEYDRMKNEAKETLKSSTEVKTVKSLREKYGLSLLDAREIVDAVK